MTVFLIEKGLKSIIGGIYIVDLLLGACYWNASRNIMFSLSMRQSPGQICGLYCKAQKEIQISRGF